MKCLEPSMGNKNTEEVFSVCGYGMCSRCKWLEGQIPKYKYDLTPTQG